MRGPWPHASAPEQELSVTWLLVTARGAWTANSLPLALMWMCRSTPRLVNFVMRKAVWVGEKAARGLGKMNELLKRGAATAALGVLTMVSGTGSAETRLERSGNTRWARTDEGAGT